MAYIILLLLLGGLFFFLETVLVGGIWAIVGSAFCLWATYLTYADFGVMWAVVVGVLSIAIAFSAFALWLWVIPKTSFGKKIYLTSSQDGHAPSVNGNSLIGREGVALTLLVPSGKVEIDGNSYDAMCEVSHIEKGDKVKVVAADSFILKVIKI